jgi:pyruvate dehydrogenase E2 component (dihydrolipoamide acetyltransferase)
VPAAPERSFRALIAARVTRSKAEIPHFYLTADAEFDALATLRAELNADPLAPCKVSVTVLLALAAARALRLHPDANMLWRDGRLVPVPAHAIGIAVETPAGVMAPLVPVESGPYRTAEALDAAVARARTGRLGAGDVGDAVLGLSNVGMFGVRALTPIIDPDQSFMLGIGAPHVAFRLGEDGTPRAIRQVTLSLACDHRAIDGAPAARFLATIVEGIERPLRLLT